MPGEILQVDKNLQAIRAIEGAWTLPGVPDEVKLDLAGNTMMNPTSMGLLFNGLSADLEDAGKRQAFPTRADFGDDAPPPQEDKQTQLGLLIAGATGIGRPQILDINAPQRLKQRLSDEGYLELSPEDIQSDRWLPEYSFAARELNFANLTKEFQGDKPGSASIDQIFGFVDEWLSPRGLYRAAVELDLWWDLGQIGTEFEEWGGKLEAWNEDKFNVRKLIDVATGPLDDILFPALNLALMWTGFTEVVAVARGLRIGVEGAKALAGVYRGSKGLRFAAAATSGKEARTLRGAADIVRFAEPSFVSKKLGSPLIMEQWRRNSAVILGKKFNQQALRAGFTSNLQQAIDSDRGNKSLDHFTEGQAGDKVYETFSNPMFDWGVDLLLFPTNIWNPGTFSRPARAVLARTTRGFRKAAENQDLVIAWDRGVRSYLAELDPAEEYSKKILDNLGVKTSKEAVKRYKVLSRDSVGGAIADTFFDGDKDAMGEAMAFVAAMSGMDMHARGIADAIVGTPLHELDHATRRVYHRTRDQLTGQLRILNPDDVGGLLDHIAKYGDDVDLAVSNSRRSDVFYRNRRKVEEGYLETVEARLARDGGVAEGHTRYVGDMDPETGLIDWKPAGDVVDGDPFFIDVFDDDIRRVLRDDAESVLSGAEELPDVFWKRYRRPDGAGNLIDNRLSDAKNVRLYDPEKLELLRWFSEHHNDLRAKKLDEIMGAVTPASLEQYVYEVLPTFGRWNEFTESSAEIAQSMLRGELDNARFVSPMSDSNRRLAAMPWTPSEVKWTDELFATLLELPGDEKLTASLLESVFSPFARMVDPQMGSFTAAALDTVTKQEALAFGATANRTVRMLQSIRRIKALPDAEGILRATAEHAKEVDQVATPGLREALAEAVGSVADTNTSEQLALLARYADDAGVTIDDVERVLTTKLNEINALPDWSEKYLVPTQINKTDDITLEVQAKIRELKEQSYFMASEVEGVPKALVDNLRRSNYKLVYGVEFAQPFDMDGIFPHFAEAARKHVRMKALGDFFSRQDPKAISALKTQKVRESLHATLGQADSKGGRKLNFGPGPDKGNADQRAVLNDLWEILHEVQEEAGNKLNKLSQDHLAARIATRASLARIPFDLTRLASDLTFNSFTNRVMGRGYSRDQARAMYKALQKSQALGFRTHGLYAIESRLRSEPNLLNGLRLLGSTAEGDRIRKIRVGMGAVVGGYGANLTIEEGEDRLTFENMGKTLAGTVLGGVVGGSRLGIPGVRGAVDALEKTRALKYAYLADYTANLRDLVRFSLSPIFDASRYTEAIILNQLGELPAGLRNLRVNQSPSSFRRFVAKEHRAKGLSADEARRAADAEWGQVQVAFGEAANNLKDFDWEVIDGVGRRFSSVGILGFSPVDWMASTFGHIVRETGKPRQAYEIVRDIYTYGTTGRSAAELSMNFVFFPFSFTKKTVGHFAKFFSDDLGRLIVTHDMLATYQLLNDKFNLSEEWKDRLPLLDKIHRLNLLAYGVGLGRFGGVNAGIIEAGVSATARIPGFEALEGMPGPSAIANIFIPQMVPMNQVEDADTLWDTVRGIMPVMNDITTMTRMLVEQAYVVGSQEHLTSQAEQRAAWDEWRTFQKEVSEALEPAGLTWKQAVRRPELNAVIQRERTKISKKYPAWKQGLGDGIAHGTAIEMELKERIQFPESNGDLLLATYDKMVNDFEDVVGATFSDSPESMPPEVFRVLRALAIRYSKEDPEFLRMYNRFYRRNLGDIMRDVTA